MTMLSKTMQALKADTTLINMLAEGENSIYHLLSPDAGTYPVIVVSVISEVPALCYDDEEQRKRLTVRIHVLTDNGAYTKIVKRINKIMKDIGYIRKISQEIYEDNLYIKMNDYVIDTWSDE